MLNKNEEHVTKDGKVIQLKDITDSHLINIINFIERRAREGVCVISSCYGVDMMDMDYFEEVVYGQNALNIMDYDIYVNELKRRERMKKINFTCPHCGGHTLITSPAYLEAEIAQLKKDKLEFTAQCFHKDETISVLENRITELEFDNSSLIERVNQMALKPNQAVIEYFYPKHNPENRRIENLPTEECPCIVELYSGEYDIVWWIDGGFEETGWDGYCVDEVKSWAYLPAPPREEE